MAAESKKTEVPHNMGIQNENMGKKTKGSQKRRQTERQQPAGKSIEESQMEVDYVRIYAPNAGPDDAPIWSDEFE